MAKANKSEIEQELKISLSYEDLERVFEHFSKDKDKEEIRHKFMPRHYYDTENLSLHDQGVSLRIQYKPGKKGVLGGFEQTVKFELTPEQSVDVNPEALYRKECKDEITRQSPDLGAVSDPEGVSKLSSFKDSDLRHIFTAAIERRFFNIKAGKGADKGKIELAFDVGQIVLAGSDVHQDFAEIEIELKEGSAAAIESVKQEIFKLAPSAVLQSDAKSAQGSKLYKKHRGPSKK